MRRKQTLQDMCAIVVLIIGIGLFIVYAPSIEQWENIRLVQREMRAMGHNDAAEIVTLEPPAHRGYIRLLSLFTTQRAVQSNTGVLV